MAHMKRPDPGEVTRLARASAEPFLADLFFARGKRLLCWMSLWALGGLGMVVWAGAQGLAPRLQLGVAGIWLALGTLVAWRLGRCPRCEKPVWALPPLQEPSHWLGFPKRCPHCHLERRAYGKTR